jgi:putative FmdB family regulatory protein
MPVFDFECTTCRTIFSELIFGDENIVCPNCGAANVKKLFSPFYTISSATRFETHDRDLPNMDAWRKAKQDGNRSPQKRKRIHPTIQKSKKISARAAVHHRKRD